MRVSHCDIFDRWTRGAGLVAVAALAWSVAVPDAVLWSAVLAAGLIGAALATVWLEASAEPKAAETRATHTDGAGLRPIGETRP